MLKHYNEQKHLILIKMRTYDIFLIIYFLVFIFN